MVQAVAEIKRLVCQRDIKGAAGIADRLSLLFNPDAKEPAYVVSPILWPHCMLEGSTTISSMRYNVAV